MVFAIEFSARILCSLSYCFLRSDIMAGVDSTPYTADARPDQTLRQVLHTASVPEAFRLRLAEVGVLTNDVMANLGESPQAFVQNIKALLTGDNPFGEAPQSIIVEAKLVSSWRKSRALMESTDSKRSKLMEDPHKIPEIPIHEYNSYRANFVARHPDVLVVDYKEPHKKFLERLIRDLTRQRCRPSLPPGRRSAYVARMWSRNPASLPRQKCCSRQPRRCPQASQMNRIHALFMALEYVNVVSYAKYKRDGDTHVGGSLDYLAELERRRRDTPGLQFLLLADERMRRKVYQLTTELKGEYPSFSAGLRGAMKEHAEIWSECRMEVLNAPVRRAALADLSRQPDKTPATGTPNPPGKGRRVKRTANAKARAEAEAQKEKKRARRSSPSRSPPRSYRDQPELARPKDIRRPEDKPRKVPEAEWKAMIAAKGDKDACRFWNSSCGCQNKACVFSHVCLACGRDHRWIDRHYKK